MNVDEKFSLDNWDWAKLTIALFRIKIISLLYLFDIQQKKNLDFRKALMKVWTNLQWIVIIHVTYLSIALIPNLFPGLFYGDLPDTCQIRSFIRRQISFSLSDLLRIFVESHFKCRRTELSSFSRA